MGVPQRDFSSDYATGQLISKSFAILLEQRQSIGLSSPSSLGAHHALSRGMKKKVKMCLTFERNCGRRKMLVGQTAQTENGKKPNSEDLRSMLYCCIFLFFWWDNIAIDTKQLVMFAKLCFIFAASEWISRELHPTTLIPILLVHWCRRKTASISRTLGL